MSVRKIAFVENRQKNVIQIQTQILNVKRALQKYNIEYGLNGSNPIMDENIKSYTGRSVSDLEELMGVYKKLLSLYTPEVEAILAKWDMI